MIPTDFMPLLSTSYLRGVIFCLVLFSAMLRTQEGIVCHFCNSKEGSCSTDSMQGTRQSTCARGYDHCALYKIVFPNNNTTAQVTRGCERECTNAVSTWTVGIHQKTSYCKMCCSSDFCNDQLTDPCNQCTSLCGKGLLVFAFVSLGLYIQIT